MESGQEPNQPERPVGGQSYKTMFLKRDEARRVRRGHPWVYSNEVDVARSPLKSFAPGEPVELRDHDGGFVAWIDAHPHALLCGRVTSRAAERPSDADWLREQLQHAHALRAGLLGPRIRDDGDFYRLAYGESDGLPGLVVDRYGDVLVVQTVTAGMEARLPLLVDVLVSMFAPRAVVLKNDGRARQTETLPSYVRVAYGEFSDPLEVHAQGIAFVAPLLDGQKTGWYYDHAPSRRYLATLPVAGAKVLDVFSYVGAWSLAALAAGAAEVTAVDSAQRALDGLRANAELHGYGARVHTRCADALPALQEAVEQGETFDVVILDPPALIPRRSDAAKGRDHYRRLNAAAMKLLKPGGLLVSASCSGLLSADEHMAVVRAAARQARRQLLLFHRGSQAEDHPVHPMLEQSEYLKCLFLKDVS